MIHRRISKLVPLAILSSLALIPTAAQAQLEGSTLSYSYYAYGGLYSGPVSFVVQPGTLGNFIGYFNILADNSSITFQYTTTGTWSPSVTSLAPTIQNGIAIDSISAPTFTNVTIDKATNMTGFNSSDLSFTGSEIQVNWANLSFNTDTIVKLDVNAAAVPEPSPAIALGLGVLPLLGLRRRLKK